MWRNRIKIGVQMKDGDHVIKIEFHDKLISIIHFLVYFTIRKRDFPGEIYRLL